MRTLFHSEYEVLSRRASLIVFVVIVFFFLVLATRTEVNGHRINEQQRMLAASSWENCVRGRLILERFNAQQVALADIERSQKIAPAIAAKRIKAYESAIIDPLPNCGPRPR